MCQKCIFLFPRAHFYWKTQLPTGSALKVLWKPSKPRDLVSIQEYLRKTMEIPFLLPVQEHCHYFSSFFFYLSKPFSFDMHKDPAALQYCGDWAPGMMTKLEVHVTALAQFSVIAAAAWTQVTGPVPLTWDPAYTSHVTITCQVSEYGN